LTSAADHPPLTLPAGVTLDRVNPGNVAAFLAIHLGALLVFVPWFFSWAGVAALAIGALVFGVIPIAMGYHRLLTHRSFRTPLWFEHVIATLAMCTLQETPARWIAWHRMHHLHSDHDEDPHSPLVSLFWSHVNWLIHDTRSVSQQIAIYDTYARDVLKDRYYLWLEKLPFATAVFWVGHALLYLAISACAAVALYGPDARAWQLTWSLFVWGVVARTVWVWHVTWMSNSLTHVFGYRNFETPENSRNNWFVAICTLGEGWHNNHHADQMSATVWVRWWEVDPIYLIIRGLALVGLATDIQPPRHLRKPPAPRRATPAPLPAHPGG
jgi:fatty-acid desaturase